MKKSLYQILILLLILVAVLSAAAGCGKKDNSSAMPLTQSYSGELVTAIAEAATGQERTQAVEAIVSKGFSLGLVDVKGKQLNPNLPDNAISLSPVSVDTYAMMEAGGHFRTIEYIVGFLADAGVELESTGALITVKDFLPDLQAYVNRSFRNPDDPASVMGMMIASGLDMTVPASPPTLTGQTMISPLTSLFIMGDVLIGVESGEGKTGATKSGWFVKKAYAADDAVQRIHGLITTIKPLLGTVKGILPEKAQRIIAAFEACDRLSVRMWEVPASSARGANWVNTLSASLPVAKNFKLVKGKTESLTILGGVGIYAGVSGLPLETLEGVQSAYRFQLLSGDEQGTGAPLYDDADAELKSAAGAGNHTYSSNLNGHRLSVDGKGNTPFVLAVKTMSNEETRRALLHASARISAPDDLYAIAEQRIYDKLGKDSFASLFAIGALGVLPWDSIKETMELLNRDFQPTPWMCFLEFSPVEKKVTLSPSPSAGSKPSPPTVRITSPADGATFIEKEKITVSVTAVDYLGKPISADYIKTNAKWVLDSGSSLSCTPLSDGNFEIDGTLPVGAHKITVSIAVKDEKGLLTLKGTDYVDITIVPQYFSSLETLLKKNWTLYLNIGGIASESEIHFHEDGTFFYMNQAWKAVWTLSGSTIKMNMSYDYKSGPNMIKQLELTGTLLAAKDGDYRKATMQGTLKQWNDWEKDKSLKTGTWTAD